MNTDLTFITNEKGQNLKTRFQTLIRDTRFFDCLVGYFYTSGFFNLYKSLENTEKIRILIGISTNKSTFDLMEKTQIPHQMELKLSHAEAKERLEGEIEQEFEYSEDSRNIEEGVEKFVEWIRSNKLQIRAFPSNKIHAKLYIMTFSEGDRDIGRVITGSSNFTQAGLIDNLEFNVELKDSSDCNFALDKFNELWADSVDVGEKYVETIKTKTWLNQTVTPYELYLKFLYEYFKDELNLTEETSRRYIPEDFKQLEYQEQAVLNAKKILMEYGGVFISDVVGLGKTYIAAMLASQLDGRTLVIAPPVLLDKSNPGSWYNVMSDFRVPFDNESIGRLDDLLKKGVEKYTNIIIDEAHRFRTESNLTYEKLAEICRGKRVILVTATPYNNSPRDILSQIKLFQNAKKSMIPNLPNIEAFFAALEKKLKKLDRQKNRDEFIATVKENAREIREKVLKYLMVRRTRSEISEYFSDDLKKQKLKFPEVEAPVPLFYELNDHEDAIFNKTIILVAGHFRYARYTPMLYLKEEAHQLEKQSQINMMSFMRILLVKRLESSFYAFRNSIERFIHSYERFIQEYDKGRVYFSKKYANKIFDLLENDDDEAIQRLIDEGKAQEYKASDFKDDFRPALQSDFDTLKEIREMWSSITRDPKLLGFTKELQENPILKKNKIIIFTESKETATYLADHIGSHLKGAVLAYHGSSNEDVKDRVIDNFDAKVRHKKDDYRILVSTEVLSEGVNLHRANVVINYDIPWNPTRMMQRVGRINRVDTAFDRIYTFNFFPTKQSNDQIKLKEAAEAKINAFLTLLGGDAALLTEGEPIGSHELFNRLLSVKTITGEDGSEESELKYLHLIKTIRNTDPVLFDLIKRLPKKARSARENLDHRKQLLTYFRRDKIQKFFLAADPQKDAQELDFLSAAKLLETTPETIRGEIGSNYYDLLDKNKGSFLFSTTEDKPELVTHGGKDSATQLYRILRAIEKDVRQLTDDQEAYLQRVKTRLEEGALPKQTAREALKVVNNLGGEALENPLKVVAALQSSIPAGLLQKHRSGQTGARTGRREVILSEYFTGM